jgi:Txe/YoeB family toxin of Txe-Axe toxin-antitoxin module
MRSRRIDEQHRLVYQLEAESICIQCRCHYVRR